jgi:hypothetical protein
MYGQGIPKEGMSMLEPCLINCLLYLGFIAVGWDVQDFSGADQNKDLNPVKKIPHRKVVAGSTKALQASEPVKKVKCPGPSIRPDIEPLADSVTGIEPQSREMRLTRESREP